MAEDKTLIEAIDLTKRFEDKRLVLDALTFNVRAGEIYCLLGARGAGKSTTINLFLNLIEPTNGRALVNGIDVTARPLEAKKHLILISGNTMLYEDLTARQNLEFFAKLAGRRDLKKDDYHMTLREVGLREKAFEQKVRVFTPGMRQKVGMAIAIVKNAVAILLDEPTSGLDPDTEADLLRMLKESQKKGNAILITTEDPFCAKQIATRVGILKEGRKVMERTREEFAQENLEVIYFTCMLGVGKG